MTKIDLRLNKKYVKMVDWLAMRRHKNLFEIQETIKECICEVYDRELKKYEDEIKV